MPARVSSKIETSPPSSSLPLRAAYFKLFAMRLMTYPLNGRNRMENKVNSQLR